MTSLPRLETWAYPEARDENPQYTVKLDIFSFGALIIHTFIGKVPDVHDVPYDQTAVQLSQEGKIELTRRKKAIQQMTTDHCMYPLIVRCLHDKPASRPTTDELCGSLVDLIQKNDAAVQKTEIQAALKQQFRKGDVWFLVDIRWIKQWMKFIGYKPDDQSSVGKKSANPGPLDNSNLSNTHGHLRERLVDEMDYFLIPESAWNKLASWYGLSPSSKVISRRVIEYGLCEKHLKVEVYLLEFQLCAQPYLNDVKTREFSRADTVSDLESAIREEFGIPLTRECRVWHRYMANTYELLSKADQSLHDVGLYNEETVMLEKKNDDGSWPHRNTVPCGLSNPGNTSFMNSVLHCLSNTVSLTNYFLEDYKKHIDTTSTLGTGGAIAEAYAALIEELWCGKGSVIAPKHFLVQVRRYASQLTDLVEHDANELLAILLDSLHEDLNLVKTKLSIDMTVPTKGREEQDIAEEWWHKHLQRNQSMIVKLFQGQLRTTLECSKCKQTSKTFDPFTTLSLQLPPFKGTRNIYVCLVRSNPFQSVMKYKLKLLKNGRIMDLKTKLGSLCDIEASHLAVTDVYNGRFHRIYADKDPLSHIVDKDDIYCYQLQKEHIGNRKMVHVPVYMRAETEPQYSPNKSSRYFILFGFPIIVYVPADATYRTLYTAVVITMRRYVKLLSEVQEHVSVETGETEKDLFQLTVVNCYGSQDIKKLVDDPQTPLQLSGSTYIACDWDQEVKEQCYNEEKSKEFVEHQSVGKSESDVQLMDCLDMFTVLETVDDNWHCPKCKEDTSVTKKNEVWTLPDVLTLHLMRLSKDSDKLNVMVDFPVSGLDLSSLVRCPNVVETVYDLYAVCNRVGGAKDGHYTASAKKMDDKQWYQFDDSIVSETREDRLVTAAAYILFYRRRGWVSPPSI
ncbi:ubiquitin carboxyl-terminal hydrolase 15-like isoform X3 [Halichondria panicea]|uniref:ubiquitin carboxyl-terminal hydrolase 15-like isoform X3 n=1 Tax=Halichondria panicea TaxID=6063 RepID=UPI00312B7105